MIKRWLVIYNSAVIATCLPFILMSVYIPDLAMFFGKLTLAGNVIVSTAILNAKKIKIHPAGAGGIGLGVWGVIDAFVMIINTP